MFKIRYWSFSVTLHFLLDNSEVQLPQNFIHYFTIAEKAVGNDIKSTLHGNCTCFRKQKCIIKLTSKSSKIKKNHKTYFFPENSKQHI